MSCCVAAILKIEIIKTRIASCCTHWMWKEIFLYSYFLYENFRQFCTFILYVYLSLPAAEIQMFVFTVCSPLPVLLSPNFATVKAFSPPRRDCLANFSSYLIVLRIILRSLHTRDEQCLPGCKLSSRAIVVQYGSWIYTESVEMLVSPLWPPVGPGNRFISQLSVGSHRATTMGHRKMWVISKSYKDKIYALISCWTLWLQQRTFLGDNFFTALSTIVQSNRENHLLETTRKK